MTDQANTATETDKSQNEYRVLARKYRPQNFDELIGQDALVRTLKNAIETGRVAHAFMLTGVRGVGKTTTARIIAKALNYTGADGNAEPTTGDTLDCQLCQAISEDRHPDVLEMDAASRTGIDDIREILDGVRYAPSQARYKIYIIDEVHMLSKQAFNALLKTLEEPPPHVKFIFATTEIRKVPITVLSRCQRFDLRRVDVDTLTAHFKSICDQEKVTAEDEAITMIARAADGSVRDGLSLLDQAISLGDDKVTAEHVKSMIGIVDRARTLDLMEHILTGNIAEGLNIANDLYEGGADPLVMIQDMLDLTHALTKFKAVPQSATGSQIMTSDQALRALEFTAKLSMPSLGKTWQILMKGVGEVNTAPNPKAAAEMILIRLAYAANLPDPAQLIKKLQSDQGGNAASTPNPSPENTPPPPPNGNGGAQLKAIRGNGGARAQVQSQPQNQIDAHAQNNEHTEIACHTLQDVVQVLEDNNALVLASHVYEHVRLVSIKNGALEFYPADTAPSSLANDLTKKLSDITRNRWIITLASSGGQPTLSAQAAKIRQDDIDNVLNLPQMKEFLTVFPDAELLDIVEQPSNKNKKDKSHD